MTIDLNAALSDGEEQSGGALSDVPQQEAWSEARASSAAAAGPRVSRHAAAAVAVARPPTTELELQIADMLAGPAGDCSVQGAAQRRSQVIHGYPSHADPSSSCKCALL